MSDSRFYCGKRSRVRRPVVDADSPVDGWYEYSDTYDGVRLNYLAQWVHEMDMRERHHRGRKRIKRRARRRRIRGLQMQERMLAEQMLAHSAKAAAAIQAIAEAARRIWRIANGEEG